MRSVPNIRITPRALKRLRARGHTAVSFVQHAVDGGGCLGITYEILTVYKPPPDPDAFHKFEAEGITIYVDKNLAIGPELVVKARGLFGGEVGLEGAVCRVV